RIFALTVMSNHLHALLGVDHAAQLAGFMQHLLANIAKEVGRHHRWHGPFWSRRYRSIVVADADSQVRRLQYILCHGLKEGLVERADRWPGASTTTALTKGTRLRGIWYDRTAAFDARRRGVPSNSRQTERIYEIPLCQLPALADESIDEYRNFVRRLVQEEERAVKTERALAGKTGVLGAHRILEQHPHDAPSESDRSPAPLVHAASQAVREAFGNAYTAFVDAFRAAAACLRGGGRSEFPEGAFPPSLPFVTPKPAPT